jgi:hypothetical protein
MIENKLEIIEKTHRRVDFFDSEDKKLFKKKLINYVNGREEVFNTEKENLKEILNTLLGHAGEEEFNDVFCDIDDLIDEVYYGEQPAARELTEEEYEYMELDYENEYKLIG